MQHYAICLQLLLQLLTYLCHLWLAIEFTRIHAAGIQMDDQIAEQHTVTQRHCQYAYLGVGQRGLVIRWYNLATHQPCHTLAPQIAVSRSCSCSRSRRRGRGRGQCGCSAAAKAVGGHRLRWQLEGSAPGAGSSWRSWSCRWAGGGGLGVCTSVRAAAVSALLAALLIVTLMLLLLVTFGADWVTGRRLGRAARA